MGNYSAPLLATADGSVMTDFSKYATFGAYHWDLTVRRPWWNFDPRTSARYDSALDVVRSRYERARGLDLGCGDGVWLYKASTSGHKVFGVDAAFAGLTLAQNEFRRHALVYPAIVQGSSYALPFASQTFDYVVSLEVIEHLVDPSAFLAEAHRVLKPNGTLIVTTPMARNDGVIDDPFHCVEYDERSLRRLLSQSFSDVAIGGLYPKRLDQFYYAATGVPVIDRCIRAAAKIVFRVFRNPYGHISADPVTARCANLFAQCTRR
jgi:2-polyprenyl-3-methyl-5-hydroxy-6-metoxy-1,4-benzoquinol methylase